MVDSIVPFVIGMKVGHGYNRLTSQTTDSPAVTASSVSGAGGGGQSVTSDCLVLSDVAALHKAVGVTADASGAYCGFSASAKVDYLNTFDCSSFSTYVMVKVCVKNAFESIDSPEFLPDAVELLKTNNSTRFHERFGDCYITGIQRGGEYFAIYQISGTNQNEIETTATDVRAAYGSPMVAGVELHTQIKTAMSRSSSHLAVDVHVFREGIVHTADLSLEDIMQTARDFPVSVSGDKAFDFEVLLQPYEGLKSPNDAFDYIQIQNRQDVLADLAKKRFEFLTLRDNLSYIQNHIADFQGKNGSPLNKDDLVKEHAQVIAAINTMETEASACSRDATKCAFTVFDAAAFDVPVLAEGPMDSLATRGLNIARQDQLAMAIRTSLPTGLTQRGFDLCMAEAEGQTLPGPGKQRFHDELPTSDEKHGFEIALPYILERNRYLDLAKAGLSVAQAIPILQKARDAEPPGLFTLGFDIAAGVFGDPAIGDPAKALGHTEDGPGAQKIRNDLSGDSQRGFDVARKLNLGPPPLRSK
jgi:hypothetical protein